MSVIALRWAYSQKNLTSCEKSILAFLASHNFSGPSSHFKVSTMAAATSLSEKSVRRSLKLLEQKNLIRRIDRFSDDGTRLSNECILIIPIDYVEKCYEEYENSTNNTPPPGHTVQGDLVTQSRGPGQTDQAIKRKNINNKTKRYCPSAENPDQGFDQFWEVYPNKQGKIKAKNSWLKMKLDKHVDDICHDIKIRLAHHGQWQEKQFIPHASTYLNQRRWQDEIVEYTADKSLRKNYG